MKTPPFPIDEKERLAAVKSYGLLDTPQEENFNNITNLVAEICEVPIALVTILDKDRNFLKSRFGVPFSESPRSVSFCGHAILDENDLFIVEDAREDERFIGNPLVDEHDAIFYAGAKLINPEGYALGTLCIFDQKPRKLTDIQKKTLRSLAKQVMVLFEERRRNVFLQQLQAELRARNNELQSFAGVVSHDMKMPLANIITTTDLLKAKYKTVLNEEALQYLSYLKQASFSLSNYISGLLTLYKTDETIAEKHSRFGLNDLLYEIVELYNDEDSEISYPPENNKITSNRTALQQIFLNLIGNSIKYNDKPKSEVKVDFSDQHHFYQFSVSDNGMGIAEDKIATIFDLFTTGDITDKDGNKGQGIGLSTVKKLVERMGGEISVSSEEGKGSQFIFTIQKQ